VVTTAAMMNAAPLAVVVAIIKQLKTLAYLRQGFF
jgi:hypothetical protein